MFIGFPVYLLVLWVRVYRSWESFKLVDEKLLATLLGAFFETGRTFWVLRKFCGLFRIRSCLQHLGNEEGKFGSKVNFIPRQEIIK